MRARHLLALFGLRLGIHLLNLGSVVLIDDAALDFERIGDFAGLHGERLRKEDEALDFLIGGEFLLEGVDVLRHISVDARVGTQFLA